MNVLELAQQMYNDQKLLQAKRIDGYAICPLYHYEQLTFSVSVFDGNYDATNPKFMIFDANCVWIDCVGFTGLHVPHVEFADALKQYLAQDVK